jgi:RNA polymerase sigma-70 factor (ECF subfamily)
MNKTPANPTDDLLIRQTLSGDRDAFGQLIRKYQDRLFTGMVHVIRNDVDAEDVVQEAFILALTKLDSFQGNSAFFTWLYRIAFNVAITRLRRKKRSVSMDRLSEESSLQLQSNEPLPDQGIKNQEQAQMLMLALGKLSEEHRSILVLREIDELDYETISQILDLPIGTVRSRLHRARLQLKQLLELMLN